MLYPWFPRRPLESTDWQSDNDEARHSKESRASAFVDEDRSWSVADTPRQANSTGTMAASRQFV